MSLGREASVYSAVTIFNRRLFFKSEE